VLARLKDFLLALGLPGVFLVAFLDSAAIPLPGGPDAVVMLIAWKRPSAAVLVVLLAALGSMAGCLVLYHIGRKGGVLALSRFRHDQRARVHAWLERNDFVAVFTSVAAPPPFPTKLLILTAGVVGSRRWRLALAVLSARILRFGFEAFLGARFGDHAASVLKEQYPRIALVLVALVLVWVGFRFAARKRVSAGNP